VEGNLRKMGGGLAFRRLPWTFSGFFATLPPQSRRSVFIRVVIMIVRISRILAVVVVLILFADVRPAMCEGWSLWNPFASDANKSGSKKKPVTKLAKKEPSMLDKASSGTKNFFNKTGETLGLKKPESKKPQYAVPKTPVVQSQRKQESKSWLSSLSPFKSEPSKKPKDVGEWMSNTKRMDP
jgi:hypothetical protein